MMIGTIYFIVMGLVLFIVPQLFVYFLTKNYKLNGSVFFLVLAFLLPLSFLWVPESMIKIRWVNFLQHSIGGGVAVGLATLYLIQNLKSDYNLLSNFFVQTAVVYFVVSALGVANEVFEFFLDYLKIGYFSADRYDTWYDLVANTTGAMGIFFLYKILEGLLTIIQIVLRKLDARSQS